MINTIPFMLFNTENYVHNVEDVYVDGILLKLTGEYIVGDVSILEGVFGNEISNQYKYALALNPEVFYVPGKMKYTIRVVANEFADVIQDFEFNPGI